MMTKDEERMFGISKEDIQEQYIESLTARLSGLEMVVAGILSDCQEMLSMGTEVEGGRPVVSPAAAERVRKQMNIAKFVLFEMMDAKRGEEV